MVLGGYNAMTNGMLGTLVTGCRRRRVRARHNSGPRWTPRRAAIGAASQGRCTQDGVWWGLIETAT
eukprot:gene6320-45989_t